MRIITDPRIPTPKGHYSPIIEHNGLLYVSGQLPVNPEDETIPEGIEAQTLQALKNVEQLLIAAGSNKNQVLQMRIYIPDTQYWGTVNTIYAQFFESHKPARCVVPSRELHYGCLIEIEATAYL